MESETDSLSLEMVSLCAESDLWLMLSASLTDPFHRERVALLGDLEFRERLRFAASLMAAGGAGFVAGPGELDPGSLDVDAVFDAYDELDGDLEEPYRALFGFTVSLNVPPCEMEFEPNSDIFYRTQRMADVAGFYRAFGMDVSGNAGERVDHVTTEAEFLHFICLREYTAIKKGELEVTETCRNVHELFFKEHVGWWLPAFANLLHSRDESTSWYHAVSRFAASLSGVVRHSFGLSHFKVTVPVIAQGDPSHEPEGTCFRCVTECAKTE